MTHRQLLLPIATALSLLPALAVGQSAPSRALPTPGAPAWETTTFPKIERHTLYAASSEEAAASLRGESRCSASALVLPLDDAEIPRVARLRWRWVVDQSLEVEDERVRAGDDFAARVYALFPFDRQGASLARSIRHKIMSTLYGREIPGQTLNYVWASRATVGDSWTSPYNDRTHVVALRSGADRGWHTETVDLAADFRRLSGQPYRPPIGIGLMVDSDDTCSHAVARFADFEILPPEPAPDDR